MELIHKCDFCKALFVFAKIKTQDPCSFQKSWIKGISEQITVPDRSSVAYSKFKYFVGAIENNYV